MTARTSQLKGRPQVAITSANAARGAPIVQSRLANRIDLEGLLYVDIDAGVVAPPGKIDAEVDARGLRREPAHADADARQVGFLSHIVEGPRHFAGAGEHDAAEATRQRKAVLGLRRGHRAVAIAAGLVAAQVAARAVQAQVEKIGRAHG